MHIEVWEGEGPAGAWFWHFVARNGKITADAEPFISKAHAIRAAKAVVRGVVKPFADRYQPIVFTTSKDAIGVTRIEWS